VTVGFQGESGAFSEAAALALFGAVGTRGFGTFDALVAAVDVGVVDAGLIPCENTIYGSIARTYDLLAEHRDVRIVGETTYAVVQALIGCPGATVDGLESVASHPVALEQCRAFLAAHPGLRVRTVADTAGAVREMMEAGDPRAAAIGPAPAAARYGASVLLPSVQDDVENVTRFFAIARPSTTGLRPYARDDKSGDARDDKIGDARGDKSGDARDDKIGDARGDKSGDARDDKIGDARDDKIGDAREDKGGRSLRSLAMLHGGRVCVALDLAHEAGSLSAALGVLAGRGSNLRSLVARPARGRAFHYRFYLEFEDADGATLTALERHFGGKMQLLGRY